MKAYLLSLLLIFVLFDSVPTVSSAINLDKLISDVINNKGMFEKFPWKNIVNHFKNTDEKGRLKIRRPPSNFTEVREKWLKLKSKIHESRSISVEIDGLKTVKEYLSRYGYMPRSKSFTNDLDPRTESAIKTYQKFFNLKASGMLDEETVEQMALLRCGVPDVNFTFHLSETRGLSWPLGTGWFPKPRRELTYSFPRASKFSPKAIKVFRDSFKRWSLAVGVVNFTETTEYDTADIKIAPLPSGSKLFGVEMVGATVMVKQSYYHKILNGRRSSSDHHSRDGGDGLAYGIMFFDNSKYWAYPTNNLASKPLWKFGVVDLETVVMHQIGHLVGLRHSSDKDSIMYPSILPDRQRKVHLSKNDEEQIHKVYLSGVP